MTVARMRPRGRPLMAAATVLTLAAAVPLGEAAARSRPARVLRSE